MCASLIVIGKKGFVAGEDVLYSQISLLLLQVIIIMSLARGLGWLLSFAKEPLVIAEMLAGILLGPTVMGRVPGFTKTVFPDHSIPLLNISSQLGLALFMFVVGLELDVKLLRSKISAAAVASVCGVVAPMIAAVPLIWVFYKPEFLGQDSQGMHLVTLSLSLSLFLAASSWEQLEGCPFCQVLQYFHFLPALACPASFSSLFV